MSKIEEIEKLPYEQYLEKIYNSEWHELVDFITLQEALYWAAFRAAPPISDDEDFRFCHNEMFRLGARYSYKIGHKTYAVDYPNALSGDYFPTEHYEQLLAIETLDAQYKMQIRSEYEMAKKGYPEAKKNSEERQREIEELLEPHKHDLFLKLKKGELVAYGNLMNHLTDDEKKPGKTLEESKELRSYVSVKEAEEIPTDFWKYESIDWDSSGAESSAKRYASIYFKPMDLIRHFKVPKSYSPIEETFEGKVLKSKGEKMESRGKKPRYPWDDFHAEVARYILKSGKLPKNQSALVNAMLLWCTNNWGTEPAESIIKEQIAAYYKVISG